uniref:Response regulatory domain-containing protein n=1 Tax=Eutreptiella gymnastica TaxID=73025 RepID=A0A7S4GGA7_9EUGL
MDPVVAVWDHGSNGNKVAPSESRVQLADGALKRDVGFNKPVKLLTACLLGAVYFPLTCLPIQSLSISLVVVVHSVLLALGVYFFPIAGVAFENAVLRFAARSHSLVCVAHCLVVLLILGLRPHRDGILNCAGHLIVCGILLGGSKACIILFLFEQHYMLSAMQGASSTADKEWWWILAALKRRFMTWPMILGVLVVLASAPIIFMVFYTMEFKDDCTYIALEPWRTATFVAASAMVMLMVYMYAHLTYVTYNLPGSMHKTIAKRLAIIAMLCILPPWSADFYVLYAGTSYHLAACLNYCAWFNMMGLMAMQYSAETTEPLGLQVATFLDENWRVITSCAAHKKLLKFEKGTDFGGSVVEEDQHLLDQFDPTKAAQMVLLRVVPDGATTHLKVMVLMTWMGDGVWSMHLQDITGHAGILQKQMTQMTQYHEAMYALQAPMMVVNDDLQITFANFAMMQLADIKVGDFRIGQPLDTILLNANMLLPQTNLPGNSRWVSNLVKKSDGSTIPVEISVSAFEKEERPMYTVLVRMERDADMDDPPATPEKFKGTTSGSAGKKQDGEQLDRAFVDRVNDKIRNPLNGVKGLITNSLTDLATSLLDDTSSSSTSLDHMSERPAKAQTVLKDHISTVQSALQLILTTNDELANILKNPNASPLCEDKKMQKENKKTNIVMQQTEGLPASPRIQHFPDLSTQQYPDLEKPGDEEEFQGWNVLLCDDSPLNLRLLKHRFEKDAGFSHLKWKLTTVSSGEAAISKYLESKWNLIVMDKNLDDGGGEIDGWQATTCIRAIERGTQRPPTIIIGATAHDLPKDIQDAKNAGQNGVWGKPYPSAMKMKATLHDAMQQTLLNAVMEAGNDVFDELSAPCMGH